jgi:inorganic pyrophosphatase
MRDLEHNRREGVRRSKLVGRLRKRDEDRGDTKLMVREVLDEVRVETKDTQFVRAHDAREELHE